MVGDPQPKIELEAEFNEDGTASASVLTISNISEDSLTLQQNALINQLVNLMKDITVVYGEVDSLKVTKKEE